MMMQYVCAVVVAGVSGVGGFAPRQLQTTAASRLRVSSYCPPQVGRCRTGPSMVSMQEAVKSCDLGMAFSMPACKVGLKTCSMQVQVPVVVYLAVGSAVHACRTLLSALLIAPSYQPALMLIDGCMFNGQTLTVGCHRLYPPDDLCPASLSPQLPGPQCVVCSSTTPCRLLTMVQRRSARTTGT